MDYKELIDTLRKYPERLIAAYTLDREFAVACHKAAATIETLLKERDAAINDMPKECMFCGHRGKQKVQQPCYDCWYKNGTAENWQWRGPRT